MDFEPNPWLNELVIISKLTEPTFHPFPRLPKELRLAIWKFSLPPPRRVCYYHGATRQTKQTLKMPSPPATLWVSQESRFIALERFTLTSVASHDQHLYKPQYLSLSTDIFDTDNLMSVVVRSSLRYPTITSDLAQIRHMIIDTNTKSCNHDQNSYPIRHRLLHPIVKGALPGLREVVVVVHGAWHRSRFDISENKFREQLEREFEVDRKRVEDVVEWVREEVEKEGVRWNKPKLTIEKCEGCEKCSKITECVGKYADRVI